MDHAPFAVTAGAAERAAAARLAAAGVPEPHADAAVLLAAALGTDRAGVVLAARRPMPPAAATRLADLVAGREARIPLHYLLGEREFWSMPIRVDARVLIPRPETELVVETACRVAPGARRVLDAGTGSGAIAAALARELPAAEVWAADRDPGALAVARTNLARHAPRVRLICGDWLAPLRPGTFDLIVANPPYVAERDLAGLEPEVRDHEPRTALVAGADGLADLCMLLGQAAATLGAGGWLVMEMGAGQAGAVLETVTAVGRWARSVVVPDAAGIDRVVAVQRHG
ncbi:MAG: peptide chain release factor N(5)-glutamine methyltransferase [Candidatus Binatia bacterium]